MDELKQKIKDKLREAQDQDDIETIINCNDDLEELDDQKDFNMLKLII